MVAEIGVNSLLYQGTTSVVPDGDATPPPAFSRWGIAQGLKALELIRALVRARLKGVPLEFCTSGLTAKCQLTAAFAACGRGRIPHAVGEGLADFARRNQPLTRPASPYPPPWERAVINSGPAVNPNVETRVARLKGVLSLRYRGTSPPLRDGAGLTLAAPR